MKIELNIVRNEQDEPVIIVTSPESDECKIIEISAEEFDILTEQGELFDRKTSLLSNIFFKPNDDESKITISAWKPKEKEEGCYGMMVMEEKNRDVNSVATITISKAAYKKFRKIKGIYKLELAYKQFKEVIESRID